MQPTSTARRRAVQSSGSSAQLTLDIYQLIELKYLLLADIRREAHWIAARRQTGLPDQPASLDIIASRGALLHQIRRAMYRLEARRP